MAISQPPESSFAANRLRPPSIFDALLTIMQVTWLRMRRGRSMWLSFGILLLVFLMGGAGRSNGWHAIKLLLTLVLLLIPALHCSGMLGDEIDDRTYTYLFTRPIPRALVLIAKWAAAALVIALLFVVTAVLLHKVMMNGVTPYRVTATTSRIALAAALGVLASSAMAASLGALFPKRPFAIVLGYVLVQEMGISSVGGVLAKLSITKHVLLVAAPGMNWLTGHVDSTVPHVLWLLGLTAAFLLLGYIQISRQELRNED